MHTYESWRITYQSAKQAARAAYQEWQRAIACKGCPVQQGTHVPMGTVVHPDDLAVDALAAAMKAKLARQRAKGYGGWDTDCTQQRLSDLLRGHVDKGDPVDVANFCAFLLARGEGIAAAQQGVPEGWKLVPVEPQDAQQAAGATAIRFDTTLINKMWTANKVYREMVAAAPQSPATHPTTQGLDADTQHNADIGAAVMRACKDLPEGAEIQIYLERGAGTVHMTDWDGNEFDHFNEDHEDFACQINAATDGAIAAKQVAAQAKQAGV